MGRGACGCLMFLAMASSGWVAGAQMTNFDRNAISLDPAHGGADAGARLSDQSQEKDVTLEVAAKLRSLLAARGFNVTMTRKGDLDAGTLDQRAELANRSHAVACVVLHASPSTAGVVVGTSALGTALMRTGGDSDARPGRAVAWSRAQEAYAIQSGRLANLVGTAVTRAGVPVTMMRVVLRPLDNLMCPAISIEVGTHAEPGEDATRQRLAESIADTLTRWRNEAQAPGNPALQTADSLGATP